MNKKNIFSLAAVIAAVVVAVVLYDSGNSPTDNTNNSTNTNDTNNSQRDQDNNSQSQDQSSSTDQSTTPQKQSGQSTTTVLQKPVVYTAYGHSPDKPVPNGQSTSTSCSTEPNIECYIVFRHSEDQVNLPAKVTDADGAAVWQWTAGEDVPSGTWSVFAVAGDKTSDAETIYVE